MRLTILLLVAGCSLAQEAQPIKTEIPVTGRKVKYLIALVESSPTFKAWPAKDKSEVRKVFDFGPQANAPHRHAYEIVLGTTRLNQYQAYGWTFDYYISCSSNADTSCRITMIDEFGMPNQGFDVRSTYPPGCERGWGEIRACSDSMKPTEVEERE